MALQLRKHGIKGVRPLLGGYHAWKELGYPLETVYPEESVVGPDGTLTADGAA